MHVLPVAYFSNAAAVRVVRHSLVDSVSERWRYGHSRLTVHLIPLQEILTVKSDDVVGRVKTYEAIIKGDKHP